MYAKVFGMDAAKRAFTPPEKWVKAVTDKTGADFASAMEERNEMAEEAVEFLESLIEHDFTDPDETTGT